MIKDFLKAPDTLLLNVNFGETHRHHLGPAVSQALRRDRRTDEDPMGREHFWFSEVAKGNPEKALTAGIEHQLVTSPHCRST